MMQFYLTKQWTLHPNVLQLSDLGHPYHRSNMKQWRGGFPFERQYEKHLLYSNPAVYKSEWGWRKPPWDTTTNLIRYYMLRDGSVGLLGQHLNPGELVTATRLSGETKLERVGEIVSTNALGHVAKIQQGSTALPQETVIITGPPVESSLLSAAGRAINVLSGMTQLAPSIAYQREVQEVLHLLMQAVRPGAKVG